MAAVNLGTGCKPGSDATLSSETSGAAITIGQDVYKDTADGKIKLLGTAITTIDRAGVAMTTAAGADAPIIVQWDGTITGTATLVVGEPYFSSATPGSVAPAADIGTGQRLVFMGFAPTTTTFKLKPFVAGVAHA